MNDFIYSLLRKSERYTKTDMVYFVKNTFWINSNTVIVTILSFGLSLLFSHFVSKEVYGTYQFLISISSMLGALTLTGMNAAVGQAVSRGFENVFTKSIKVQLKFSVIPVVAGLLLAGYYFWAGNVEIAIAVLFIGITMPLTNILNTWGAYLTGKSLFKPIFFYSQVINVFYYGAIVIPILWFPQTLPIVLANIVFGLLSNFIAYKLTLKKYPPNINDDPEAIPYGKRLSLSNILPMAVFHIDNIVVFHLLGATDLAIYSFASNIPDRFISLLRPIPSIAFPKFSEKSAAEVSSVLIQKLLRFFILSILFGVIYFFIAPFIFKFIFPQYIESLRYSQLYILVPILSTVASLSTTALFATRSSKIFTANILNPIVGLLLIIAGGYSFGIWGVIVGRILSNSFNLVANTYYTKAS